MFYNRVKGEMEQALMRMGFTSLHIFRPSFLVGERVEARAGERLGIAVFSALAPMMIGPARKVRPISATAVARAMVVTADSEATGAVFVESNEIADLAH